MKVKTYVYVIQCSASFDEFVRFCKDLVNFCYVTVRYDSCPKSYMDDVWWTRTKFGIVRIETCPSGSVGNATRTCKDNKLGWQQPVLSGCTSLLFLALNESVRLHSTKACK